MEQWEKQNATEQPAQEEEMEHNGSVIVESTSGDQDEHRPQ
jgi:hypothetical protein